MAAIATVLMCMVMVGCKDEPPVTPVDPNEPDPSTWGKPIGITSKDKECKILTNEGNIQVRQKVISSFIPIKKYENYEQTAKQPVHVDLSFFGVPSNVNTRLRDRDLEVVAFHETSRAVETVRSIGDSIVVYATTIKGWLEFTQDDYVVEELVMYWENATYSFAGFEEEFLSYEIEIGKVTRAEEIQYYEGGLPHMSVIVEVECSYGPYLKMIGIVGRVKI